MASGKLGLELVAEVSRNCSPKRASFVDLELKLIE